jgi:glucose-1-phosphate cytidylyltransferase
MKVVILAGGFGTRISEYTDTIPKPMISVGDKPILLHIMNIFSYYGYNDFCLALGYKSQKVKEYFSNYYLLNSDFTIDLKSGDFVQHQKINLPWKVSLIDTGLNTLTGGRVKRMKSYIKDEPFLLTYGDGLSDVDIESLVKFHKSHGKMVTMTAVRPSARFGELEIDGNKITTFKEKPQMHQGWINGGFFVVNPSFFDLIDGDNTMLEREPLEKLALMGELMAYKHYGFWQCMDTKRDHEILERLWASKNCPWKKIRNE